MRQAIESQIIDFKIANKKTSCELCGTSANLTVDHVKKFKDLKEEFLLANPAHPTLFGKNSLAQEIFREEDAAFRLSWETYHKEHASLRILCKPCNQNLDAYGADFI